MRKLYTLLSLFMIFGCSSPESINQDLLNKKDGVFYTNDTNKPYSGPVFSLYEGGEKKSEGNIKDGKGDGKWTLWYENGQKQSEKTYKDGKEDGLLTYWYENGKKSDEETFKDGELISEKHWNEDGSVKE